MAGLASLDVPAVYSYLLVIVVGLLVARAHVNDRLKDYPDRWAFLGAWLLFLAYGALPPLLLWFLDHTGAVQDTSLFAALLVAFGYRQLFAGTLQGVTLSGQATALWKPFQAWVDAVAERINNRQGRYLDRFAEHLRSDVLRSGGKLDDLKGLALQRTRKLPELRQAIAAVEAIPEESVARSRLFDTLWPDLKGSAPNDYGYLLYRHGLVSFRRRWWWLERGRAKTVTGASLLGVLLLVAGAWLWAAHDPQQGTTVRQTLERRHAQWRFLKANTTERDRWRAREYLSGELRAAMAAPLPLPAEARLASQQAADEVVKARRAHTQAGSDEDRTRAQRALAVARGQAEAAVERERRATHTAALLAPLLRELRYPEIPARQLDEILRLVAHHHSPSLDRYYLGDLIEALRTSNETVRLNVHRTILALQKADFPGTAIDGRLAAWEPRKDESAEHIDGLVRLWHGWMETIAGRRP
jgi:hypothetical protein